MRDRVRVDQLPKERVVVQFDFHGRGGRSYWLVLAEEDVSVCLKHPGFEIDVLITAGLANFYKLWLGRVSYADSLREHSVEVDAIPAYARNFPKWFAWSPAASTVRAVTPKTPIQLGLPS